MRLLNLGCGHHRPGLPWLNVDTLFEVLASIGDEGARDAATRLAMEENYKEMDIAGMPWPLPDSSFDGVLASHILEHFDAQDAVRILKDCYRVLAPGGVLRMSVPDASYFRSVYPEDRRENWMRLFGEGNDKSANETYMAVALFFSQHKQVYTEDALWCQVVQAGFQFASVQRTTQGQSHFVNAASWLMCEQDNRAMFSLYMEAAK